MRGLIYGGQVEEGGMKGCECWLWNVALFSPEDINSWDEAEGALNSGPRDKYSFKPNVYLPHPELIIPMELM